MAAQQWLGVGLVLALLAACAGSSATPPEAGGPDPTASAPSVVVPTAPPVSPPATADASASSEPIEPPPVERSGRGWLGIELKAKVPGQEGVVIGSVFRDSPAQAAGLVAGDVLLSVGGDPVHTARDVVLRVGVHPPGTPLRLVVGRGGGTQPVVVRLGERPDTETTMRKQYVGMPAPAFDGLVAPSSGPVPTLASYQGKVLVLEFWATWCAACQALVPTLNFWQTRYGHQGVAIVGVAMNEPAELAQAVGALGVAFPTWADPDGLTAQAYRASVIPVLFLIDRRGVVRDVVVGNDPARIEQLRQALDILSAAP